MTDTKSHILTAGSALTAACLAAVSLTFGQAAPPATAPAAPVSWAAVLAPAKTPLIEYFTPTPIIKPLVKDVWGAANVLPRDAQNGLEDHNMMKEWCYWDGQILKAKDGKFHMFASRWDQSAGHSGWGNSKAVHAVSDTLYGPYADKGLCWPDDQAGKGHNVTALQLPKDEGYAVIISETRPGTVYVSKSLDGPWKVKGPLTVEGQPNWKASNVTIMLRPDGDYEIVQRSGILMISKAADGICGPYKVQGQSVYPRGIPNLEDPFIFYTGGLYHITVNSWSTRKAYHLTSQDGISNWKNRGSAYDPDKPFIRYTDGTINNWSLIERPAAYIEDGIVKAFTFAVLDVPKNQERGNDIHGSKIVVVPFDGEKFNKDFAKLYADEAAATAAPATAPAK